MPSKRKSYACSICHYRTNKATSLSNHKCRHHRQAQKELENTCFEDLHTNVDSAADIMMQNIETNICLPMEECIPNISYYDMTMDDFEEHLLHDCYGVMEYDENDIIDYDSNDDGLINNNITELNIIENDDDIN